MTDLGELRRTARLRAGEAQIWRLDAASVAHNCWPVLQPDEVEQARRFRVSVPRNEFVAGRAMLRLLLARELGCVPREVRLRLGAQGKPMVDGIEFNVAHTRGVVLIALSRAGAVGLDIEREDRTVEAVDIARASFHPEEVQWIEQTAEAERPAAFFRCWTRKEAVTKADGRGLSMVLNSFSVCGGRGLERENFSLAPELRVQIADYQGSQKSYYLRDLYAGPGMAGALACTQPGVAITMHEIAASNGVNRMSRAWKIPILAGSRYRVTI